MPKLGLARLLPHLGRLGRASRWKRTRGRPRVWAHRGDSANAPENTMRAFELAVAAGADGLELDVRFDGDGNVVVFHDSELDRLTGQRGRMETTSAAERAKLRVQGEPVPLLADVLHHFDLEIDVEIKSNRLGREGHLAAATSKVIKDSGREDQILVSSFDPVVLLQVHRHLPAIGLAHIFAEDQNLAVRRGWIGTVIGVSIVHPQHTLVDESSVKRWHTAGRPINVWTVDDEAELLRLARLGVDGVFANDPAHARKVFEQL
ncbi:MAG: glycerophosphodiester phosphodiesterase [Myxococcales bacterium]|nr:glycerophosphodiester phosphodiesterase [Myxococcales bacterium]